MRRKRSLHRTTVRGGILFFFGSKETRVREVISSSWGKLVTSYSMKDRAVHVGLTKMNRRDCSHSWCLLRASACLAAEVCVGIAGARPVAILDFPYLQSL